MTRDKIKEIVLSYGHGFPSCAETMFQTDWWREDAASILDDIFKAFHIYEEAEDDEIDDE